MVWRGHRYPGGDCWEVQRLKNKHLNTVIILNHETYRQNLQLFIKPVWGTSMLRIASGFAAKGFIELTESGKSELKLGIDIGLMM